MTGQASGQPIEHDPDMLLRAAEACRNAQKQMTGETEWFLWVPEHLTRLAASRRRKAQEEADRG